MSNKQIKQGTQLPPTLKRDQIFILHDADSVHVNGLFCGTKADKPVCIDPKKISRVIKDYEIAPWDMLVIVWPTGMKEVISITLPNTELINQGHEVVIQARGDVSVNLKCYSDSDQMSPVINISKPILWDANRKLWINL